MKIFFAIAWLVCLSADARSQMSRQDLENLLTNGDSRGWQFNNYTKTLGSGCAGNWQLFTFYKTGKVQRKRCLNDTVEFKELSWRVEPVGDSANGEWQLVLGTPVQVSETNALKTVRIDLPLAQLKKKGQQMIWRVVADCKTCFEQTINLTSTN